MFKVNDSLAIELNGKKIVGKLIGVDTYCMDSFSGKKVRWISHTLVSDAKNVFSRYWITNRGKQGWFLSTATTKKRAPKNSKVVLERSGIARIEFVGDKGVSTPTAALLAYQLADGTFFTIERFSGSEVMFFAGRKIQKPITVRT